ncbi:MAG: DUF4358 domain-containing protein [Clostridia bacterium]|nr:DUF4358 domain-containing protein [Clostridia bacterium]
MAFNNDDAKYMSKWNTGATSNAVAVGYYPDLLTHDWAYQWVTSETAGGSTSYTISQTIRMMSGNINEFFIAKVADGKMDTVKAACEARQKNLAGGFLYPSQTELVNNYKIVTSGSYLLFCITDDTDAAVQAFDTYAK